MKILFATDGSEYSEGAARFLTKFKFDKEDLISVFHAVSWLPVMSEYEHIYEDFRVLGEEVAPRILNSTAEILRGCGAKIETGFTENFPENAIIDRADETGADLIVMGARGLRGLGSNIVGSVTKAVSVRSHKPVFIIKPPQLTRKEHLKILYATDGSDKSNIACNAIMKLPFHGDTEVIVLNVLFTTITDIPDRFALEVDERIRNIVAHTREEQAKESEQILDTAFNCLSGHFQDIDKKTVFGDPASVILETAEDEEVDIIAMGSSGKRGISALLGSVSRYIMNHSKCSILIGKD